MHFPSAPDAPDVWQHALCDGQCTFLVAPGPATIEVRTPVFRRQAVTVAVDGSRVILAARRTDRRSHVGTPTDDDRSHQPPSYLPGGVLMGVGAVGAVAGLMLLIDGEITHAGANSFCGGSIPIPTIYGTLNAQESPCDPSAGSDQIAGGAVLATIGAMTIIAGGVTTALVHRARIRRLKQFTVDASASRDGATVGATVRF